MAPASCERAARDVVSASFILLLLAAAALHAAWNLLLKPVQPRYMLMWGALVVSTAGFLPLLAVRPSISGAWLLVGASAVVEAGYYALLMAAYGTGDFSVVYPIARGAAPALLATWAVIFLGERPGGAGLAGLGLIVAGLFIVGSTRTRSAAGPVAVARPARGAGLALVLALLISIYSVIDGAAVKRVDPFAYTVVVFALTTLLLTPLVLEKYGWPAVVRALRVHVGRVIAVGVLQCLAYMTVLYVYSRAQVSYAGAIRESSIVLGALAGWLYLGEQFGRVRLLGALVMFGGIVLIALAR
jgi:drug/metabolite transporter (DMT)-like permease